MNSTGATAAMLNDRICTISVVPTLAPSMMASAGTRLTSPSDVNELVISAGRGAALEQGGQTEAGAEGGEAVAQRLGQQQAQIGSERAQDPAVDHVQAPQQQRDAAHQVEKNEASHALPVPKSSRRVRLSPNEGDQPFNLPKIAPRGHRRRPVVCGLNPWLFAPGRRVR